MAEHGLDQEGWRSLPEGRKVEILEARLAESRERARSLEARVRELGERRDKAIRQLREALHDAPDIPRRRARRFSRNPQGTSP